MSLRLTLVRHAKSSWNGDEGDHERPLSKRGRHAADALGQWLSGRMPEEVLCSDAARAQETWARVAAAGDGPAAHLVPRLYHADCEAIFDVLRSATARHVGLVGHNPGIALFAARIVSARPAHPRFGDYPTGATTIIKFAASDWRKLAWKSGEVADFIVPREL